MRSKLSVFISFPDDTKFLNFLNCYNRTKMVNLYRECGMNVST